MKQLIRLADSRHLNLEICKCRCCSCIQFNYHLASFIMERNEFQGFLKVVQSLIDQKYSTVGSETSYINVGSSMRLTLSLPDLFELDKCVREAQQMLRFIEIKKSSQQEGWSPANN